ncbi:MAG: hypothetical protein IJ352_08305 [Muribaculaceae bacterium]|nr:hypothetical protein [Muribaculaceae bacterium]
MPLPSTNITTSLVTNKLHETTTDVGSLCKSDKINMWSKWKPIATTATTLTTEELVNKNYGITIITATTPLLLLSAINDNNNVGANYNKPIGGSVAPFRLGDFRNYNHNADIPVVPFYNDGDVENIGNVSASYSKQITTLTPSPNEWSIGVNDLYPQMNRGLAIYDESNNTMLWSTTSIPYGKRGWQQLAGKEIKVIEFYTNIMENTDSTMYVATSDDVFCALPQPLHTITLTTTTADDSDLTSHDACVVGNFTLNDNNSVCHYSFKFSSLGSNYVGGTLSNVAIKLSKDYNDSEVYSVANLGNITLGSEEESQLFEGTLSNKRNDDGTYPATCYIHIYWNNNKKYSKVPLKNMVNDGVLL